MQSRSSVNLSHTWFTIHKQRSAMKRKAKVNLLRHGSCCQAKTKAGSANVWLITGKVPSKPSANYNANQGFTLKLSRAWRFGLNFHGQNLSIRNALNGLTASVAPQLCKQGYLLLPQLLLAFLHPLSPLGPLAPGEPSMPFTWHTLLIHVQQKKASIWRAADNSLFINWSISTKGSQSSCCQGSQRLEGKRHKTHIVMPPSSHSLARRSLYLTNTKTHPLCHSLKYNLRSCLLFTQQSQKIKPSSHYMTCLARSSCSTPSSERRFTRWNPSFPRPQGAFSLLTEEH